MCVLWRYTTPNNIFIVLLGFGIVNTISPGIYTQTHINLHYYFVEYFEGAHIFSFSLSLSLYILSNLRHDPIGRFN